MNNQTLTNQTLTNETLATENLTTETAAPVTPAPATTAPAPRRGPGRLVRIFAVLVAMIGLGGAGVVGASSATAATNAQVTVCFESAYHYSVSGTPWTREVKYILYNPSTGRWQVQARYASPNGCTRFSVYPGYATYFEAYENWGSYYYSAQTRVNTYAAGYTYNLGWFKVTKTLTF
jgi:hypothetical protein